MMVPGRRVVDCETKAMMVGTSKIMSSVLEDCIVRPLRTVDTWSLFGLGITSLETICGPRGQKVSKLFEKHH